MKETFQEYLFRNIEKRLPKGVSLAKELQDKLGIGKATVYKKIKGEVALSAEEVVLLAREYNISNDHYLFGGGSGILMDYSALFMPVFEPIDYMAAVEAQLKEVSAFADMHLWYAAYEVPTFYYAPYPELLAFKLYIWGRVNWKIQSLQVGIFNPEEFYTAYPTLLETCQRVHRGFAGLPSREFWPIHVLDQTLSQLRLSFMSGHIADKELLRKLCGQARSMMNDLHKMADTGRKTYLDGTSAASFELFFNQAAYTGNMILSRSDKPLALYAALDNPNFIRIVDPKILRHLEAWLESLRRQTTNISIENEPQRNYFFNNIQRRINDLERELQLI